MIINCRNPDLRGISRDIQHYLWQCEGMETDRFVLPCGEYRVQGRVRGGVLRGLLGLDKKVVVRLRREKNGQCRVTFHAPAWKDKALVMAAALVCCWPLAITALMGALDQAMLFLRLQRLIRELA